MNPNLKWKAAFIGAVVLTCLIGLFFLPKFPPKSIADLRENFAQRIRLGLDLKGGTHLILRVQVDDAVNVESDQMVDRLKEELRTRAIPYDNIQKTAATRLEVRGIAAAQSDTFKEMMSNFFISWEVQPLVGEASPDKTGYALMMRPSYVNQIRVDALTQAVQTIRTRIDALGVAEPVIQEYGRGDYEVVVQLPGVDDPARVKNIMQSTALLEIRLVVEGPYASESEALLAHNGILPFGTQVMSSIDRDESGRPVERFYVVERTPWITGRDLHPGGTRAEIDPERPGRWQVGFSLRAEGAARFGQKTEQNIGRSLAVVLDGKIKEVARIESRIDDRGRITGGFNQQSSGDLALVLRAGALPASIKYLEERTVGPSLGADSIRQGVQASIVGLIAVVAFMLFYYRRAGINAFLSLVLNLIILLAAMGYIQATFTLPGIAGVILTIGMGVDSNVLVFERIREELRMGKAVVAAVEAGFDRAFLTIIDTHVTTIVSAFFLFMFGTGPVRGFAVTLVIGLVANVFTAIYVSRTIFEYTLGRAPRGAELSI